MKRQRENEGKKDEIKLVVSWSVESTSWFVISCVCVVLVIIAEF